ncbi:MAG: T9SS type A sorting domain-containing protein [Bacteroidetes bacterium]|nr:T9SS type A sorting domain-containing protein [Bacteroidota bacterium]
MKKLLTIIAILTVGLVNAQNGFTITSSVDTTFIQQVPANLNANLTNIQANGQNPINQDTIYILGNTGTISIQIPQLYSNLSIYPNQKIYIWNENNIIPSTFINSISALNYSYNISGTGENKQILYQPSSTIVSGFKLYFKVIPITTTTTISTLSQITNTSTISTIDTTNCVVIHSTTLNTTYTTQSVNNTVSLTLTGNTQTLTTIGASTTIPFSNTLTVIKYRFNQSNNQWFNYPKTFIYTNTLTIIGNSLPQNTVSINTTTNALQLHPHLSIISNSANVCIGGTSTLTVSGANTYTWSTNENGINISVSPTVITTYTVSGTDNNGCVGTASITAIDCSTITGIAAYINNNQIKIYPNPANLYVNIENSNNQTIEFINLNGQTVLKSTESIVNIESLKQGIYFVKCGNAISKFVKE